MWFYDKRGVDICLAFPDQILIVVLHNEGCMSGTQFRFSYPIVHNDASLISLRQIRNRKTIVLLGAQVHCYESWKPCHILWRLLLAWPLRASRHGVEC